MSFPRASIKSIELKQIDNICNKLSVSAKKTINFFEEKLQEDGSYGTAVKDIACYFKSPMMFILANKEHSAKAVLKHIKTTFMTSEGDFKTSENLKSDNGAYIEFWTYTNGWIVRAAEQLNITEIVEPGFKYLSRYYRGEKSGFATNKIEDDTVVTDVLTVAHHGLLYLEMNKLDLAIEAGNFLSAAINKQPNLKKGFYLRSDKEGNLITDFSIEKNPFYIVSTIEPNQLHFMIGYPAAFLAILYKKTKNPEFLIAAKAYLDFSLSCHDSIYFCDFSHKIAWAASLVYECTGESKYLTVIDKITDYFIEKQQNNGMWFTDDISKSYDQSAEIACWFLDIEKNINNLKKKANLEEKELLTPKSWKKTAMTVGVLALAAGIGIFLSRSKKNTATSSDTAVMNPLTLLDGKR